MARSMLSDQFTSRVWPCVGWVHTPVRLYAGWVHVPVGSTYRVDPCAVWVHDHVLRYRMLSDCSRGPRGVAASRITYNADQSEYNA